MGKFYRYVGPGLFFLTNSVSGIPFASGLDINFSSCYFWRGLNLSRGPVLQPAVWFSLGSFSVTPWANFMLGGSGDEWGWSEFDFTIDYEEEVFGFGINPSVTVFFYPAGYAQSPAAEIGFSLTREIDNWEIASSHYFDIWSGWGAYFGEMGGKLKIPFCPGLDLDCGALAGWGAKKFNELNYNAARWAVDVIHIEVGLSWKPEDVFGLRSFFGMGFIPDQNLRIGADIGPFHPVFGVGITKEF